MDSAKAELRRAAGKVPNGLKRACPQGHPYTKANTCRYRGKRHCRACRNARPPQAGKIDHRSVLYQLVHKRDHGRCRYCGAPDAATADHVVARSRNGVLTEPSNVVLACATCNTIKGREGGFTLSKNNVLRWQGKMVAPGALFGAPLMALVKEQRLRRQRRKGLTALVEHAIKEKEGGASCR